MKRGSKRRYKVQVKEAGENRWYTVSTHNSREEAVADQRRQSSYESRSKGKRGKGKFRVR